MNEQVARFRLGVFVLGAAILLAVLIILFGDFPALFSGQMHYTITFPMAPGVEQGTPVRRSGVKIGEVQAVDLNPDTGEVTVRIFVEDKYQLRRGDRAEIGRGLFLGETAINFVPEGKERVPAPEGYQFQGKPPEDIRQALGKATDLADEVRLAIRDFRDVAKNINDFVPDLRKTNAELQVTLNNVSRASEGMDNLIRLNQDRVVKTIEQIADLSSRAAAFLSDENQRNVNSTLKNAASASDRLDGLVRNADELVTESKKTVKSVNERVETTAKALEETLADGRGTLRRLGDSLTRLDEVLMNVNQAAKPVADRSAAVMKNLEEGTARLNQVAVSVGEFTRSLTEGDGTLRRLVQDPALYNNLNETAASLSRAMQRAEKIVRDVELFADKIARHPELLGVSGAVHPSSGIKR